MDYNRTNLSIFNDLDAAAMDAAGWTADEKNNGKLESKDYNPTTKAWDIPNTTSKTTALIAHTQNPDESDDYVYEKQTDSETVIDQSTKDELMATWFPPEQ